MQSRPIFQERFCCKIGKNLLHFFSDLTKALGAFTKKKKEKKSRHTAISVKLLNILQALFRKKKYTIYSGILVWS